MSRLIIKNLPKKISEEKLRNIFDKFGSITDIQLKFTAAGKFRQLAFIGYQNEDEAHAAINELNNTFIQTSRISVETCARLGDTSKPKAWSKHTPDNNVHKNKDEKAAGENIEATASKKAKKKKKKVDESIELLKKYKDDPLFEEFLQVHNQGNEIEKLHRLNEDEDDNDDVEDIGEDSGEVDKEEKISEKPISDLEYMEQLMNRKPREKMQKKVKEKVDLFTVKLTGLPYATNKRDIKDFFKPLPLFSIRIPRKIHGIAYIGFKMEQRFKKALEKNKSFMKGKQVLVTKFDQTASNTPHNDDKQTKHSKWISEEESLKNEESIAESGRIFVRNLSYTTTKEDLEQLFTKYGPLTEVQVPIDNFAKIIKGFATITFMLPEHAVKAYGELDGSILHGRMLHLLPGKEKETREDETDDTTNFKKKKAAKQKSNTSYDNWNSLFLYHDAVAQVVADTYGSTKEALFGPNAEGSAGVRLALGETQLVADTRRYLEEQGVVLDAFKKKSDKKSSTVLLVKNLPSQTTATELEEVFGKYGEIARVILPPHGISAVIEFLDPTQARTAYSSLAYTCFKSKPFYLEFAPENCLKAKPIRKELDKSERTEENKQKPDAQQEQEEVDEGEPEDQATIYVKNLNFKTTEEDFKRHFAGCGKIHYATIVTRKDRNNPDQTLSSGYGFVGFYLKSSADKALNTLELSVLDGKSLELQRSDKIVQQNSSNKTSKKASIENGSKLLVRNVPFQANKSELYQLFSSFGMIKSLRLPTKMTLDAENRHRGFAFVDFATNSQAKAALEALGHSTHLYGRRLVLEWASQDEDVEALRKRTADHFKSGTQEVKFKKSIFTLE